MIKLQFYLNTTSRPSQNYRDRDYFLFWYFMARFHFSCFFGIRFRLLPFDTKYKIFGLDRVFFACNFASALAFFPLRFWYWKQYNSKRHKTVWGSPSASACFLHHPEFVAVILATFEAATKQSSKV